MLTNRTTGLWLAVALLSASCDRAPAQNRSDAPSPAAVAEELAAADRAFAEAAATTDLVTALTAMFADSVLMPTPAGTFAEGVAGATAALDVDTSNRVSRAEWEPIRAGVSADGLHGFTFGYMIVHRPDSTRIPLKYLAWWVKDADGWKVSAYKRGRAGDPVVHTPLPPSLPEKIVAPVQDEAIVARHAESLRAAEQAFSDEAQVIGLGAAFRKWGSADAVNMGGGAAWIVGAGAIGDAVGAGGSGPSPVSWSADRVRIASTGDLGITFGRIRSNSGDTATAGGIPFFTIWHRAGPSAPWRYMAE